MSLNQSYWSKRYQDGDTPWDLGAVSPPLQAYFDTLEDKDLSILIPGAGRAYEARYLMEKGFSRVFVCDWAQEALDALKPDFPDNRLICEDFFQLEGSYDFLVEQTFFCALNPSLRANYVQKVNGLLKPNGRLVGLLFAREFPFEGPPFGGSEQEYRRLFQDLFDIETMRLADNSIGPRLGNELFFELKKKPMRSVE